MIPLIPSFMVPRPTLFPGSLFSASLGRWKRDPGCGWSCDHPESGWQKNLLDGRGGRVFRYFVGYHDHLAVAKTYSLYRGSKASLPMKDVTRFLPFLKYRRLSFTKKFGSRMEQTLLTVSKSKRSRTESKWNQVDQPFESLNSEVIYFLLCAIFWMLKVFLSYSRLAEYSDLHLINSNAN